MFRRLIFVVAFVVVFVPVHMLLTARLLHSYWYNYGSPASATALDMLGRALAVVMSVPILTPMIVSDLGENWPFWIQFSTGVLNSLIWAAAVLAVAGVVWRRGGRAARYQSRLLGL